MRLRKVRFILKIIKRCKNLVDKKLTEMSQTFLLTERKDWVKCWGQKQMLSQIGKNIEGEEILKKRLNCLQIFIVDQTFWLQVY